MSINDLPSTSSNILPSQQPENINLPLLFRHFDLQYSPIDNHVTLYNSGLYFEIDISRRLNSFGVSIAKGSQSPRLFLPPNLYRLFLLKYTSTKNLSKVFNKHQ
uniref:Uncharacterized protein n=1 Tax=Meloidogyne enterolobii TaxID=390850 RepID=A0A6V7UVJ2_MELEN|nr:unnamed protein product [Meloidogyne enterolobii]